MLGYYLWRNQKVLTIGFFTGVAAYFLVFFSGYFGFYAHSWWAVCTYVLLAPLHVFIRLLVPVIGQALQALFEQHTYIGVIIGAILNGLGYLFVLAVIHGAHRLWRGALKAVLKFFFDIDISTR